MTKSAVLAVTVGIVSLWIVMIAGITAVWLTDEVRVLGVVMLPAGIVAGLLVLYFDWRDNLRRRVVDERKRGGSPTWP